MSQHIFLCDNAKQTPEINKMSFQYKKKNNSIAAKVQEKEQEKTKFLPIVRDQCLS